MGQETTAGSEPPAEQQYGRLATALNQALAQARTALEEHGNLLPVGRLSELDSLLAEFARRRVRLALYGEVKAGKSTLVNAIAGAVLSPVAFDPLTSIPVRITYGERTSWRVGERRVESIGELERIMRERPAGLREVVVETGLDLLQLGGQVDVIDTPGVGSEQRFDAISAEVLRSLDAVVLVVRYPALFTQLTRSLMHGLESDIGKLFVVWNLDTACAELTAEERARQAETLRTNVAGAHELFLVDGRAAVRAAAAGDSEGVDRSGLTAFAAALARFAASEKRAVAALREAAKRADQWLEDAQRVLTERKAGLDARLTGARGRLQGAQNAAETKRAAARSQFAEFQAAVRRAHDGYRAATDVQREDLRRRFGAARRRWIRRDDLAALELAVQDALASYAERIEEASHAARQVLQEAARQFGTVIPSQPRERGGPTVTALMPADRKERASVGRVRWLRRALWAGWYLPGLTSLEGAALDEEVAAQVAWFDTTARAAEGAVRAVLDGRLADITRRSEAELEQIRAETGFAAAEAEFERLSHHLPDVTRQRAAVAEIGAEARGLIG